MTPLTSPEAEESANGTSATVMPAAAPPARRIVPLDGLRGLAILLVAFVHSVVVFKPSTAIEVWFFSIAHLGLLGVDLFFVLSGFLVGTILIRSKGSPHFLRNFYIRRALRIFPPYYCYLVLMLLVFPAIFPASTFFAGLTESVGADAPYHWLYMTDVLIVLRQREIYIFNPLWSLAIEEKFYLLWPFIVAFLSRRGQMASSAFWLLLCIGCRAVFFFIGQPGFVSSYFFLTRSDGLALGTFLAAWCASRPPGLPKFPGVPASWYRGLGLAATGVVVLAFFMPTGSPFKFIQLLLFRPLVVGAWSALLVLCLIAEKPSRIFSNVVLRTFGKYSYAFYLIHWPLTDYLRSRDGHHFMAFHSTVAASLLLFCVVTSLSLMLSVLSWNILEKHALRLKSRFS